MAKRRRRPRANRPRAHVIRVEHPFRIALDGRRGPRVLGVMSDASADAFAAAGLRIADHVK